MSCIKLQPQELIDRGPLYDKEVATRPEHVEAANRPIKRINSTNDIPKWKPRNDYIKKGSPDEAV